MAIAFTFDTLAATRRLRDAGFDEQQAETVVRVLSEAQEKLVTREHFDNEITLLRHEMVQSEQRMVIKLGVMMAALAGIVATIVKYL